MGREDFGIRLTQIGKHIAAVIVIPGTGPLECIEFGGREGRGGYWQRNRLVKSLLAGETHPAFTGLVGMFIAITPPTFQTRS
jgi:hypothetical protein